jgi:hypothetical protein
MAMGAVLMSTRVRMTAELVPGLDEGEDPSREERWQRDGQHDRERLEGARAVHGGGSLNCGRVDSKNPS